MTGLVAGGCNLGVFTTGRGSVYGCKPAPCIKVATNTALYNWMEEDMDINAGTILDGTETVEQVGPAHLREDHRRGRRRKNQERTSRPGRRGIRALATRPDLLKQARRSTGAWSVRA